MRFDVFHEFSGTHQPGLPWPARTSWGGKRREGVPSAVDTLRTIMWLRRIWSYAIRVRRPWRGALLGPLTVRLVSCSGVDAYTPNLVWLLSDQQQAESGDLDEHESPLVGW